MTAVVDTTVAQLATRQPDVTDWDTRWLLAVNQGMASELGDWLFPWLSATATFSVPLLALICLWLIWQNRSEGWKVALLLLAIIGSADMLSNLLKMMFAQPRPCGVVADLLRSVHYSTFAACPGNEKGMPSNHAFNFFSLTAVMLVWFRRHPLSLGLLLISMLVALSRVYLGKHFPSQVLAGAFFGLLYGLLIAKICDLHLNFIKSYKRLNRHA